MDIEFEQNKTTMTAAPSVPSLFHLFCEDDDSEVASIAPTEVSLQDLSDDEQADTPSLSSSSSGLSSTAEEESLTDTISPGRRKPLQWEFYGYTLWLELEEFDHDLSKALRENSHKYGLETIPQPHATAVYGMTHLSQEEAVRKLHELPSVLPNGKWAKFDCPISVKQDIAQVGRPGQVCNIAWAELTLPSNDQHEESLDALRKLFQLPKERDRPWTPHHSLVYDNPEDNILTLNDIILYVAQNPSLLTRQRNVKAVSLWNTEGKMADWKFIDRVWL